LKKSTKQPPSLQKVHYFNNKRKPPPKYAPFCHLAKNLIRRSEITKKDCIFDYHTQVQW
jgi:hypothetical protein